MLACDLDGPNPFAQRMALQIPEQRSKEIRKADLNLMNFIAWNLSRNLKISILSPVKKLRIAYFLLMHLIQKMTNRKGR